LFPRAAGKGKAVVPDCLVAPSAPRVAPASGGFMADARRPPSPHRHAPRSPPPPRRPAPRSSPPPGQPAVRSPAAVGDGGRRRRDEEATRKGRRGCLPFLLGIGEMLLGMEKKYRGKGDKKSICWSKFFHHQSLILRKGGKRKGENQFVGVALSGQTPHPQTSRLHS